MNDLAHHLRQAESDLGLAQVSLGMALSHADQSDIRFLQMLDQHMGIIGSTLATMRRKHGGEEPPPPPPRSSER